MSAPAHHDSHATATDPHGAGAPPAPVPHVPVVHDEAANTPAWVPMLGLALLALATLWIVYRVATAGDDEETAIAAEAEGAEGAAADGEGGAEVRQGAAPGGEAAPQRVVVQPPQPVPAPAPGGAAPDPHAGHGH